jgi:hypothetical protein
LKEKEKKKKLKLDKIISGLITNEELKILGDVHS